MGVEFINQIARQYKRGKGKLKMQNEDPPLRDDYNGTGEKWLFVTAYKHLTQ
jgi:hypothetical protein